MVGGSGGPPRPPVVRDTLAPLASFGASWDQTRWVSGDERSTITENGWELTLLNVFSVRHGRVDDPVGTSQDDAWGYGIGFSVAGAFGVRYDQASIPQSRHLESNRVSRTA
jgi:hypothetical protein